MYITKMKVPRDNEWVGRGCGHDVIEILKNFPIKLEIGTETNFSMYITKIQISSSCEGVGRRGSGYDVIEIFKISIYAENWYRD